MSESRQWLWKDNVQSTGWKNSRKAWICALAPAISLKYCWKRRWTPYNQWIYSLLWDKISQYLWIVLWIFERDRGYYYSAFELFNCVGVFSFFVALFDILQICLFNPLTPNTWFWRTKNIQQWKTLWEKDKLLVTSNFSFSHNVFYPIWYLFSILKCHLRFVSIWTSLKFVSSGNGLKKKSDFKFYLFLLSCWLSLSIVKYGY